MDIEPFASWRQWRDAAAAVEIQDCLPVKRGKVVATSSHPATRFDHATVSDATGIYLFGGISLDGRIPFYKNDLWFWDYAINDGTQWTRLDHSDQPSQRGGHSLVISDDRVLILFGGQNTNGELSDCYTLDLCLRPLKWLKLHPGHLPHRRVGHSACLYKSKYMIIHGGKGPQGQLSDTWVLNLENITWSNVVTTVTPDPRSYHTCSINNNRLFIFGGGVQHQGESLVLDSSDMFSINIEDVVNSSVGLEWRKHSPKGEVPKPRRRHSCSSFYSPCSGFVIYGGMSSLHSQLLDSERGDIHYYCADRDYWTLAKAPRGYKRWGHTTNINRKSFQLIVIGGNSSHALRFDPVSGIDLLKNALYFDCTQFLKPIESDPPKSRLIPPRQELLVPFKRKNVPKRSNDPPQETLLPEQCNITFGSDPIYKGNCFGMSVDRYYLTGNFDIKMFKKKMSSQQKQHDDNILGEKHNPKSTGCIEWKRAEKGNKANLLHQVNQLRKAAGRAKHNILRLTDQCSLCGSLLDAICTPCGHAGLCLLCALSDKVSHCPTCHEPILRVLRMFSEPYECLRKKLIFETPSCPIPNTNKIPPSPSPHHQVATPVVSVGSPTIAVRNSSKQSTLKNIRRKLKSTWRPGTATPRKSIWCSNRGML